MNSEKLDENCVRSFPKKLAIKPMMCHKTKDFTEWITENAPFAGGAAKQRAPEQPLVRARELRKGQHEDVVLC